ncbi:MAG: DUF397 domain-containing protein [Pseudonocardiaceae bacterium]
MPDLDHAKWRKSSRSGAGNACVEVAVLAGGGRAIRDTKDRSGPVLRLNPPAWTAFTAWIGVGEFD